MDPITINATELRTNTRDLMERVKYHGEQFIVETFGRPMAVIISFEDFNRIKKLLHSDDAPTYGDQPAEQNQVTSRRKTKNNVKTSIYPKITDKTN